MNTNDKSMIIARWQLALCRFAVTGMLLLPAVAKAGLEVCNITPHLINIAIAHDTSGSWESRGWWRVETGACTEIIKSALKLPQYYMLATSSGSTMSWGNNKAFCISLDNSFARTTADLPCTGSGDLARKFFRIDTSNATNFTQTLNCKTCDPQLFLNQAKRIQATISPVAENTRSGLQAGADTESLYQSNLQQLGELGRVFRLFEVVNPPPVDLRQLLIMRGQYQLELGKQAALLYPGYDTLPDLAAAIADFRAAMAAYPESGDRDREANISWSESQLATGEIIQARGILNTLF